MKKLFFALCLLSLLFIPSLFAAAPFADWFNQHKDQPYVITEIDDGSVGPLNVAGMGGVFFVLVIIVLFFTLSGKKSSHSASHKGSSASKSYKVYVNNEPYKEKDGKNYEAPNIDAARAKQKELESQIKDDKTNVSIKENH